MCLAIPGKIIEVNEDIATVDYGSEKRQAKIIEGDYKIGDYVIVQAKVISDKVSPEQMQGWLEILKNQQDLED